jgi:hypothetical protein
MLSDVEPPGWSGDVVDIDVWVNVKAIVVFAARDDAEARDS